MTDSRENYGKAIEYIKNVVLEYEGDDCLIWPFSRNANGYARIKVNGQATNASRYICKLVHGRPPRTTDHAAHSCGKGHLGCVNKKHLSWKTPKQNAKDKVIHGTRLRGETSPRARFTEDQIRKMKRLFRAGKTAKELAERFDTTRGCVYDIMNRKRWAHVR